MGRNGCDSHSHIPYALLLGYLNVDPLIFLALLLHIYLSNEVCAFFACVENRIGFSWVNQCTEIS